MNLDINLLRTFVAIVETGGFTRAGDKLFMSQSTVSLQIQRLERNLDATLFHRDTHRVTLTEYGERLLGYARRILALNDEAEACVRAEAVRGEVRIGIAQDFTERTLPQVLGRFARAHPNIRIAMRVAASSDLRAAIEAGELDLALLMLPVVSPLRGTEFGTVLAHEQLVWFAGVDAPTELVEPVPLVTFPRPCAFRDTAIRTLDEEGVGWRIVLETPSLSGILAAVRAGLGLSVRTQRNLDERLIVIEGLPTLPSVDIALLKADEEGSDAVNLLAALISDAVFDEKR